jgi:hypothetical protein
MGPTKQTGNAMWAHFEFFKMVDEECESLWGVHKRDPFNIGCQLIDYIREKSETPGSTEFCNQIFTMFDKVWVLVLRGHWMDFETDPLVKKVIEGLSEAERKTLEDGGYLLLGYMVAVQPKGAVNEGAWEIQWIVSTKFRGIGVARWMINRFCEDVGTYNVYPDQIVGPAFDFWRKFLRLDDKDSDIWDDEEFAEKDEWTKKRIMELRATVDESVAQPDDNKVALFSSSSLWRPPTTLG